VTIVLNIIERKPLHALADMTNLQHHMLCKCHSTIINVRLYLSVKAAGFYADDTAEVIRITAERKLKNSTNHNQAVNKTINIIFVVTPCMLLSYSIILPTTARI